MMVAMKNQLKWLGALLLNYHIVYCSIYDCTTRYEFRESIKLAQPFLKNCSIVHERYPVCKQNVLAVYSLLPPYVAEGKNGGDPIGLLPDLLSLIFDVCCYGCTNVTFHGPVDPLEKFKFKTNATVYMPIGGPYSLKMFFDHDYVPFVKADTVSIMALELDFLEKSHETSSLMMSAVMGTWPLLITALVMAMVAGCVMWAVDTWLNKDEFPQRCPRGPFEGFWWAFVSMTTVGYGDKCPKSYVARVFAVIWIFLGITVFSMYTAVLTAALGVPPVVFRHEDIKNLTVGTLNFTSAGEEVVLKEQGKYKEYPDITSMGRALQKKEIPAFAVDSNILQYYLNDLERDIPRIKVHHTRGGLLNSYGVISYNKNITRYMRTSQETNQDRQYAIIPRIMAWRWPKRTGIAIPPTKPDFFSKDSPIFAEAMIGIVVIGVVSTLIGLSCKLLFSKKPGALTTFIRCMELRCPDKVKPVTIDVKKPDNPLICEFADDLEDFKSKWKSKMNELDGDEAGRRKLTMKQEMNLKRSKAEH